MMEKLFLKVLLLMSFCAIAVAEPIKIIYETDFGPDSDDAAALAMLHNFADRGEIELLAVMCNTKLQYSPGAVDVVNTYFKRPNIAIGVYKGAGFDYPAGQYTQQLTERWESTVKTSTDVPSAVELYRKILADQPDNSVVIVSTGFLSNLKTLLQSPADQYSSKNGVDLIAQKVKELDLMGGVFDRPEGGSEFNFTFAHSKLVEESGVTKFVVDHWPTPIVFSELGEKVQTGPTLQDTPDDNPVKEVYRLYNSSHFGNALVDGNGSWDQLMVLYAVRGKANYWDVNSFGYASVDETGKSVWKRDKNKNHSYLKKKMSDEAMAEVIGALMSHVPGKSSPPPVAVKEGMWWNPKRSGHGVDVQTVGDKLFIAWYTYDENGDPIWYLATDTFSGNQWQADLLSYRWDGNQATATPVGTISLTFSDATEAYLSWKLNGVEGAEPIEYFVTSNAAAIRDYDYTGTWFEPAKPGYGLTTSIQGSVEFSVLYFYDKDGAPVWAIGTTRKPGNSYRLSTFQGFCPSCTLVATSKTDVGFVAPDFDCEVLGSLSLDVALKAPFSGVWQVQNAQTRNLSSDKADCSG